MWDVYTRENGDLTKRNCLVSILHPKGEEMVCNCVKDNIMEEKEDYEAIRLRGFGYKLFDKAVGGGVWEVLGGYQYLIHPIKLWPVYCVNNMGTWIKQLVIIFVLIIWGGGMASLYFYK